MRPVSTVWPEVSVAIKDTRFDLDGHADGVHGGAKWTRHSNVDSGDAIRWRSSAR
jgi:hypothetical protein